jgi:prophage regulatory protein
MASAHRVSARTRSAPVPVVASDLPKTGFCRLSNIIGNPLAVPPIPAVIPVSKSTWWAGVRSGRYPKPVKLGERVTAWRVEEIRALIEEVAS